MADYKVQLEKIEKTVQEKKVEKVRLEERKRQLEEDIGEAQKELESLGIPLDKIDEYLVTEEEAIRKGIAECQEILKTA